MRTVGLGMWNDLFWVALVTVAGGLTLVGLMKFRRPNPRLESPNVDDLPDA